MEKLVLVLGLEGVSGFENFKKFISVFNSGIEL